MKYYCVSTFVTHHRTAPIDVTLTEPHMKQTMSHQSDPHRVSYPQREGTARLDSIDEMMTFWVKKREEIRDRIGQQSEDPDLFREMFGPKLHLQSPQ